MSSMDEAVVLQEYDPLWPKLFCQEEEAIQSALGSEVLSVHHVGSTAVPGMAAKPIIDIAVEIEHYPPTASVIEGLESIGYEHMGESGIEGRHWFRKGTPRSHHVHAVPRNGRVARAQVALRDFLRGNPAEAKEYESIKRRNASGNTIDSAEYASAKSPFIDRILSMSEDY